MFDFGLWLVPSVACSIQVQALLTTGNSWLALFSQRQVKSAASSLGSHRQPTQ
jgi:hypothetical protein